VVELSVDILPYASLSTERKDIRKEEQEVSSILSHILIPHLIHGKSLVVEEGRYVWRLNIDILVTHCDGSLVDCCSMAIFGALQNLKLPHVVAVESMAGEIGSGKKAGKRATNELLLDSDVANSVRPDGVLDCPIVVTVCLMPVDLWDDASDKRLRKKNECMMIVDADRQEEMSSSSKVSMSLDREGNVCGIHKYGTSSVLGYSSGNIKLDMLPKIQNFAISCSKNAFSLLMKQREKNNSGMDAYSLNAEEEYSNFFKSQFELQ
jgi:exosome complex component RRP42